MLRLVAGLVLSLVLATPALAQDDGTYVSEPLDWGTTATWIDANADGGADYCRLTADQRLACTLSTGAGFGETLTTDPIAPGQGQSEVWGDIDGDGRPDFCRGMSEDRAVCTPLVGEDISISAPAIGRALLPAIADATGDGRPEYCWGRQMWWELAPVDLYCATLDGAVLRLGSASAWYTPGHDWVDVDADGRIDFCHMSRIQRYPDERFECVAWAGRVSSPDVESGPLAGRAWGDVDGDGRADLCNRMGSGPPETFVRCTFSTGTAFENAVTSGPLEWGALAGMAWVDIDIDGDRDFCRPVGEPNTAGPLYCTIWAGGGFGATLGSEPTDLGDDTDRDSVPRWYEAPNTGRAWVDHDADGIADYCRRVGTAPDDTRIACTLTPQAGFTPLPSDEPPTPTPTPEPTPTPAAAPPSPTDPPRPDPGLKTITVSLRHHTTPGRHSTRFRYLRVDNVPAGATVTARCPKGCSRKSYTTRNARGTVSLKRLIGKRLKVGTTITVTVSRPGEIGAVKILKVRSHKDPSIKTRCLAPGAKRPSTC